MKWPFHTAEGQILEGLESLPWRRLIVSLKRGRFSASNVWTELNCVDSGRFRWVFHGFPHDFRMKAHSPAPPTSS